MRKMRICSGCMEYTLAQMHCGKRTLSAHPPAFNPNDRYGKYRRIWKGV